MRHVILRRVVGFNIASVLLVMKEKLFEVGRWVKRDLHSRRVAA